MAGAAKHRMTEWGKPRRRAWPNRPTRSDGRRASRLYWCIGWFAVFRGNHRRTLLTYRPDWAAAFTGCARRSLRKALRHPPGKRKTEMLSGSKEN